MNYLFLLYEIFDREFRVHRSVASHFPGWNVISIEQTIFYTLAPLLPRGILLLKDAQYIRKRSISWYKLLGYRVIAYDIEGASITHPRCFVAERVSPSVLALLDGYIVHRRDTYDELITSFPHYSHLFHLASAISL